MTDELLLRILSTIPANFFRRLEENYNTAFAEAMKRVYSRYSGHPNELKAMLGQERHALCEIAFRETAEEHGIDPFVCDTTPKGGTFSWCEKDGIYLLRGNTQNHCGPPRKTKFRKQYSKFNAFLSLIQNNLFKEVAKPSSDKLCVMLVATAYKTNQGDTSVPAFLGIGIPTKDLSSWVVLKSVSEILALYNEQKNIEEPIIKVKDSAFPALKKKLNNAS